MLKKRVAVFEATSFYSREVLLGMVRYAQERADWDVHFVDARHRKLSPSLRHMNGILSYVDCDWLRVWTRRRKIQIVYADDLWEFEWTPTVIVDNRRAGQMVARHFLERGFRHFAFLANSSYYSRLRLEGFAEELRIGGFACDVLRDQERPEEYWVIDRANTAKWLKKLPKPLAVMAANDLCGMLMINLCRDMGLRVPDDVAFVGVDNDEAVCHSCSPPLSSVAVPNKQIGYEAAARLDRIMTGRDHGPLIQLIEPLGVVTRQSSDTVGVADEVVREAVLFIRDHAAEPIAVDDVVAAVPACRTIVESRFREVLGRSPSQEIWRTRIDMAKRLLMQTDLKVEAVADKCGFAGYRTFYTIFRRHTGVAPAEFRQRVKMG